MHVIFSLDRFILIFLLILLLKEERLVLSMSIRE